MKPDLIRAYRTSPSVPATARSIAEFQALRVGQLDNLLRKIALNCVISNTLLIFPQDLCPD
jgi:hypothetical protein